MITRTLIVFFCCSCLALRAQVLRDQNYNYQYNPEELFFMNWNVTRQNGKYQVFYELQLNDTTRKNNISIQWETRSSINERNGDAVAGVPTPDKTVSGKLTGNFSFNVSDEQKIIAAKVTVPDAKKDRVYLYHKRLPQKNSFSLSEGQIPMTNAFIHLNKPVAFAGFDPGKPVQVSFYAQEFPAAAPAFSTTQAKVPKTIKPDSTFTTDATTVITFNRKGLYLAQQDTSSAEGIAFRVEDDYPKLGRLETLVGPLIYICTRQEFEKLRSAGNDKKKFDQTILSITGNTERARTFMRNYFKRVEQANEYFSSYKEGWKTDRGMMYIIFGMPDEVYFFDEREVWEYKNDNVKTRFIFVKSPTVFDPDNYVLIRDKKFTDLWYDMVDLWRKARF